MAIGGGIIFILMTSCVLLAGDRKELSFRIRASEEDPESQQTPASEPTPASEGIPVTEAVRQELFPRSPAPELTPPGVLDTTNKLESAPSWEMLWRSLPKEKQIFWQIVVSLGFCLISLLISFWHRDQTEEKRPQLQMLSLETDILVRELEATMEFINEAKKKYYGEFLIEMDALKLMMILKMEDKLCAQIH
jgi:hypothetical protein